MDKDSIIGRIISWERFEPYLDFHSNDTSKAKAHYKSNIFMTESFYPLLAILEVGLRNAVNNQLIKYF